MSPSLSPDHRWLTVLLALLPWVLVVAGTALFFVGFYYSEITEADTASGVLMAVGVVMLLLAFVVGCVRNITPRSRSTVPAIPAPTNSAQLLPRVEVTL